MNTKYIIKINSYSFIRIIKMKSAILKQKTNFLNHNLLNSLRLLSTNKPGSINSVDSSINK